MNPLSITNLTGAKTLALGTLGLTVSFLTAREEHTNQITAETELYYS